MSFSFFADIQLNGRGFRINQPHSAGVVVGSSRRKDERSTKNVDRSAGHGRHVGSLGGLAKKKGLVSESVLWSSIYCGAEQAGLKVVLINKRQRRAVCDVLGLPSGFAKPQRSRHKLNTTVRHSLKKKL